MTNYLAKLINYVTNLTADSDSMTGSHIEHDLSLKQEKAKAKKKLEEFLRLGYHQSLLD